MDIQSRSHLIPNRWRVLSLWLSMVGIAVLASFQLAYYFDLFGARRFIAVPAPYFDLLAALATALYVALAYNLTMLKSRSLRSREED